MTIITKSLRNNNQITKVTEFQADAIFWSKKCAIFKKKENGTKTNNKDFSRADLTPKSRAFRRTRLWRKPNNLNNVPMGSEYDS